MDLLHADSVLERQRDGAIGTQDKSTKFQRGTRYCADSSRLLGFPFKFLHEINGKFCRFYLTVELEGACSDRVSVYLNKIIITHKLYSMANYLLTNHLTEDS